MSVRSGARTVGCWYFIPVAKLDPGTLGIEVPGLCYLLIGIDDPMRDIFTITKMSIQLHISSETVNIPQPSFTGICYQNEAMKPPIEVDIRDIRNSVFPRKALTKSLQKILSQNSKIRLF